MCSEYAGAAAGSEGKPLGRGEIDMFQGGYWLVEPEPTVRRSDTDTD